LCDPGNQLIVVHRSPSPPTAWNHQDVQWWAIVKRVIGNDFHATCRGHWLFLFSDQERLIGGRLFLPPVFIQPCDREDLEWSAEVEHLDIGEDEDSNLATSHGYGFL